MDSIGSRVGHVDSTPCKEWLGSERAYQTAAAAALTLSGFEPSVYSWITPTCGNERCIEPEHLHCFAPVRLRYPWGICIYCGRHAHTKDHLLPRNWTGEARRHFTAIVPACGTCNSILSDTLTWSITERRALCHMRLKRKYARVLRTVDFSDEDLAEFGPTLRDYVVQGIESKREVQRMLSWPEDPFYDLRALEKSGIENPYMIGLLLVDDPMSDYSMAEVESIGADAFTNTDTRRK